MVDIRDMIRSLFQIEDIVTRLPGQINLVKDATKCLFKITTKINKKKRLSSQIFLKKDAILKSKGFRKN